MNEAKETATDLFQASPQDGGEDGLNIRELWQILIERRGAVLICLLATVVGVMLVTFLSIPQYEASTILQIERHTPDILTFKDVLRVDPSHQGYKDFYQTQYKIIQSRTVLRRTVERLDLLNRPEYVNRPVPPLKKMTRWAAARLRRGVKEKDPSEEAIEFLQGGLSVAPVRGSHLVKISFVDRDAGLARDLANAVSDAYQQFIFQARHSTSEQASEFLTREVARLQSEIAELERGLQRYGSEKALLALSDGTEDISEQALAEFSTRLTEAKGRLAVARARHDSLRQAPPEALPEVLASPLINHLRQQYAQIERRHSQVAERFKPGWPELSQLEEEMDRANARLQIEMQAIAEQVRGVAESVYEQALAEVASLDRQVEEQKREVQRVNRDGIQYGGLKAEIETRRQVLSELVARQSETETSGQLIDDRASNVRVVDPAETPEKPVRPRKALNLLLSVVVGLSLGVGMAFFLHHVDNTIKSEQEIERYGGGIPVLAHVPVFEPLKIVHGGKTERPAENNSSETERTTPDMASHATPRSAFAESFRNLRTSLLLASPERPPRYIQVTSCEPRDGKSTVALNLAIVLAQMDKSVLLIDADLRRPRLHRALDLSGAAGLSSYLTGTVSLEQIPQPTEVPQLDGVSSGPVPPNPSELLVSPRFERLLSELDELDRYDHVIFDSPPAIQVADSVVLANKMDATVLVVRAGVTSRDALAQGIARLRHGRARLVGALLNAVSESSRYYYGRYDEYRAPAESSPAATRSSRKTHVAIRLPRLSRKTKTDRRRHAG